MLLHFTDSASFFFIPHNNPLSEVYRELLGTKILWKIIYLKSIIYLFLVSLCRLFFFLLLYALPEQYKEYTGFFHPRLSVPIFILKNTDIKHAVTKQAQATELLCSWPQDQRLTQPPSSASATTAPEEHGGLSDGTRPCPSSWETGPRLTTLPLSLKQDHTP